MPEKARSGELEFSAPEAILEVQNRLLREHIRYLADRSPFYRRRFSRLGIDPAAVRVVADLAALPFTTKGDLEESGRDLWCASEEEIVDLCLTSGTTGRPVAMAQTRGDLERLGRNEEISFRAAGLGPRDRVLIAAAIDRCFMAGLAYFAGLNRIGATSIRGGSSSLAALADMTRRFGPTAIVGVPTLMLALADRLLEEGTNPAALGVQRLVCIGEPVRRADLSLSPLGERLRRGWNARVLGTYASTEMATSFADCEQGAGGHLHPELMVVEIVDEEGRPVPPGQAGEVVATPLGVTGMPLVRFRTGDIAALHAEPCPCGRNSPRLGPVIGRKSQMLKVRGTTVYPPAIAAALQGIDGVRGHYIEVFDEYELSDRIRVVVGTDDPDLDASAVAEAIAARIRVRPEVALASPQDVAEKTAREGKRKPVTFFDHRRTHGAPERRLPPQEG